MQRWRGGHDPGAPAQTAGFSPAFANANIETSIFACTPPSAPQSSTNRLP